jgi:UDP-perosamine 4-acetyltransferase
LQGFLDDDPSKQGLSVLGLSVEGGLSVLEGLQGRVTIALGVGSNSARVEILGRLATAGHSIESIVHPSAVIGSGVRLGDGTFVAPLAVVHTDARVGPACIVNTGAVVEHNNVLGKGVHVSPNAALGGDVTLGDEVLVGLGAVVLPGLTVGARSVVGAGAVVVGDVPSGVTVIGVPARHWTRESEPIVSLRDVDAPVRS